MRTPPSLALAIALAIILSAATVAVARAAPPASPAENHPILGTWVYDFPDRDCTETYRFFPTGATLDTSGEEVTESAYEVSPRPAANGFYRLVTKITKGNGRKDCGGQITKVGDGSTNFVLFHSSGESFIMCRSPSLEACFGPLLRAHGKPA